MNVWSAPAYDDHALILHHRDEATGLSAIVAIHAWRDGRACGGCRMLPYANSSEALQDVLRLSRAMSYKAALANVAAGGAKAVIVGDPKRQKAEALLLAMGRLIGMLDGRYIAAPDVGIGVDDLRVFLKVSPWVCGASTMAGPSAPYTALGVFAAMKAAVKHHLKEDSLSGLKVALQGIGSVGSELAGLLATNGAELFVADIDEKAVHSVVKQYGASVLSVEEILNADVDVLSPNALGGVLNASTIPGIRASIICGAANNQLAEDGDGWLLHKKGIVFCPDYVVSAGGLIAGMEEFSGFDLERARQRILAIGKTIEEILALAEEGHVPQSEVAAQIARSRIAQWTWTLPPAAPETSASSPAGMTRPRLQLDACEQKRS